MVEFLEAASTLSTIYWIASLVISVAVFAALLFGFMRWFFRRQWALYRNLRRPIVILSPITSEGDVMQGGHLANEIKLLRDSGLLNVPPEAIDYRALDPGGKPCVVVGYLEGMAGLQSVVDQVRNVSVPLIVYTYGKNHVQGGDKQILDSYAHTLYANFPITLLNHIFTTAAAYPYAKK